MNATSEQDRAVRLALGLPYSEPQPGETLILHRIAEADRTLAIVSDIHREILAIRDERQALRSAKATNSAPSPADLPSSNTPFSSANALLTSPSPSKREPTSKPSSPANGPWAAKPSPVTSALNRVNTACKPAPSPSRSWKNEQDRELATARSAAAGSLPCLFITSVNHMKKKPDHKHLGHRPKSRNFVCEPLQPYRPRGHRAGGFCHSHHC
jgi:hypothetical protein